MLEAHEEHDSAPRGERDLDDPGVEDRASYVGGSEVGAVCGLDERRNIWHVFNQKMAISEPTLPTPQQKWGNRFERCVAEWYEEVQGVKLLPGGFFRHTAFRFCAVHPDRLVESQPKGVEIKIVGPWMRDGWGEPGTDRVPLPYLCQSQWCMFLTGFPTWDLVPFFWGEDARIYTIPADPELQQMMFEQVVAFWRNHVEPRIPPAVDSSNACAVYLRGKYPASSAPPLASTPKIDALAMRLRDLKREKKIRAVEQAGIESQLKDVIREAEGIEGAWGRITWKNTRPKRSGVKPQRKLATKFTGEIEEGDDHDD